MPRQAGRSDQPFDRLVAILEKISEMKRSTTASELAELLQVPIPTTHRMVTQLVERGLLKRAIGSKRLLPGVRLVNLSVNVLETAFIADRVHALLSNLASELGEQCHVGVITDDHVRYIASATSGRSSGLLFEPGQSAPVYCTSTGKLFLASMSPEDCDWWISSHELKAMTEETITDKEALAVQIEEIRNRGWASTREELVRGVIGYAVPIQSAKDALVAALGVSIPVARMNMFSAADIVEKLTATANRMASDIEQLCHP